MRPTAIWLRSLLERIHPTCPSPRESEELLSRLKAAFRRSLDLHHPCPRSPGAAYENALRANDKIDPIFFDKSNNTRLSPLVSTERHFQALLSHPLLAIKPTGRSSPRTPRTTESVRDGDQPEGTERDPALSFDEQAALGTATQELATACLAIYGRAARSKDGPSVVQQMRDSGAGARVLKWLWSKGETDWNGAIYNRRFLKELVPFLVVEGHRGVVQDWLCMSNDQPNKSRACTVDAKGRLLGAWMIAELRYGGGLDKAVELYLWAVGRLVHWNRPGPDGKAAPTALSPGEVRRMLRPAGAELAGKCIDAPRRPSSWSLSTSNLERFCDTIHLWSSYARYVRARVLLGAPPAQDPSAALAFLRHSTTTTLQELFRGSTDERWRREAMIKLGLPTAQRLLELGQFEEANWVLQLLKNNFPEQLNMDADTSDAEPPKISESAVARNERQSLDLLDGLLPS